LKKNGKTVALDYVSLDLSDQNLLIKESMRGWLSHMTQHPMLIKAASHLLQDGNFIVLRDMIVKNSPIVVQDETGVDYAQLKKIGKVDLYGGFLYLSNNLARTNNNHWLKPIVRPLKSSLCRLPLATTKSTNGAAFKSCGASNRNLAHSFFSDPVLACKIRDLIRPRVWRRNTAL